MLERINSPVLSISVILKSQASATTCLLLLSDCLYDAILRSIIQEKLAQEINLPQTEYSAQLAVVS